MSLSLEALQKQIESADDLYSIVSTMKALAATSVRQYERASESLDAYFHTVQMGLSVVLESRTEEPSLSSEQFRPVAAIILGSDHGLVGRFNEQITSYALEEYWFGKGEETGVASLDGIVLAAGEQVATRAMAAGVDLTDAISMPSSIAAITPFVQSMLERIEGWRSRDEIRRVILFYNRPQAGGFSPRAETLLPIRLEDLRRTRLRRQFRSLPTFTMSAEDLLSALLRQYFFVAVYRACAQSLAAENMSRLMAMQGAEKSIDERLESLRARFQQGRQNAITEELLDIVSGFKSIRDKRDAPDLQQPRGNLQVVQSSYSKR